MNEIIGDSHGQENIKEDLIYQINFRFNENRVGYQFIEGRVIRIDSEFLHSEVVKPALVLLDEKRYRGPQDEFLKAHEHYRHKRYRESVNACLHAFESTMKVICGKRKWDMPKNPSEKKLIETCITKGLIPEYWHDQNAALSKLLENGVLTGRNKNSRHVQGKELREISENLISYMLHMTASNIVFLARAEKEIDN